jgi:hypothetical protein
VMNTMGISMFDRLSSAWRSSIRPGNLIWLPKLLQASVRTRSAYSSSITRDKTCAIEVDPCRRAICTLLLFLI